jgi:putative ABC transport system permease protein
MNYIKIVFRNIKRHKGYSFINIGGLAIGIACSLIIFLYVAYELSFDSFNANRDRIYRITQEYRDRDKIRQAAYFKVLPPLQNEIPEIENTARLFTYSWKEKTLVSNGEKHFFEERFFLADPSLFEVFSLPFAEGYPGSALSGINSIVISESMAKKYFGEHDPIGKTIAVKNYHPVDFIVTGVFKDCPANAHFHCDFIAPLASGENLFWKGFLERNSFYTYALMRKGSSADDVEKKINAFMGRYDHESAQYNITAHLQQLGDIHLHSHLTDEIEINNDIKYLYLLSALSLIILLSACINFINLATARSEKRTKEIGLRKVLGAYRIQLITQLLSESLVLSFLALPLAFILTSVFLPAFNRMFSSEIRLGAIGTPLLIGGALTITLICGIISGCYPAFLLSAFQPMRILKGGFSQKSRRPMSRNILVVLQSAVSTVLIVGTLVVYFQMRYISNKNLGFNKDQIVILQMKDWQTLQGYSLYKNALQGSPDILGVTASAALPSNIRRNHPVWYEGAATESEIPIAWNAVDEDFLKTYDIKLAAGRGFSREFVSDERNAYIVNEAAVKQFGWESPIGKKIALSNRELAKPVFEKGEIIGVVQDFHFQSMHKKIDPLVLKINKLDLQYIAVKIQGNRIAEALKFIGAQWKNVFPERPFDYSFFDSDIENMYKAEMRMGEIFNYATLLSIIIAGLGLYGLASFSAAARTKEIGIRKTLGASSNAIVALLIREFGLLFIIANIVSLPLAYYLMNGWLQDFAYRIALGSGILILASLVSFLVLVFSVGSQSLKAAHADPVKSLRYE